MGRSSTYGVLELILVCTVECSARADGSWMDHGWMESHHHHADAPTKARSCTRSLIQYLFFFFFLAGWDWVVHQRRA